MFDKIKKLGASKAGKLVEEDDQQNFPLLERTINENIKQTILENSIKDVYKVNSTYLISLFLEL
jgi:hypothetical protein